MFTKLKPYITLIMLTVTLIGCSDIQSVKTDAYYTFQDDRGLTVTLAKAPERVVALVGSYGEMWLMAGGTLAGVTDDALSERKLELDDSVRMVGKAMSPNLEEVLAANPDFLILSDKIKAGEKIAESLQDTGVAVAYFREESYTDFMRIFGIFTDITKRNDLFTRFAAPVDEAVKAVIDALPLQDERPTVLLMQSMTSKVSALKNDCITGIILDDLGAVNIANEKPSLMNDLSMEVIMEAEPDFIFVVPMGDEVAAKATLDSTLTSNPAWGTLKAVKDGNFHILPKDLFQYKPNARWGESYEYLEKLLYAR